jgi:hypothetical protein
MVRNIVIVLILAVVGVPSWQIGTIMIQKKKTGYVIQEQANKIKKYDNEELVKGYLKKELELLELPTEFKFELLERRRVKITYTYSAAASLFGHTYYEVSEIMEKVTEDSQYDSK